MKNKTQILLSTISILFVGSLQAQHNNIVSQTEKIWLKTQATALCADEMHGRGYVKNGRDMASRYLQKKFREFKLKGLGKDGSYVQGYAFPVNTFPGKMKLVINDEEMKAGADYIIDPSSVSFTGNNMKLEKVNTKDIADTAGWTEFITSFDSSKVYYFDEIDPVCNFLNIKAERFIYFLPKGCYIFNEKNKLTWSVKRDTARATVFYVKESALPKKVKNISIDVQTEYIPRARSENIIGYLPGVIKDSFIAFTAHYDHLGMMGDSATFPGASDNASGVAMLLYLANWFSAHPQRYSILFIAFSGEETGLLGSTFYVSHPLVSMKCIKFLTNIDIMGDATDGITVVNATEFPKEFENLKQINKKNTYLPVLKSRGKTSNSDHAPFYEAGVPSFYVYSNGGKGFYHDIYDKAKELSLTNVDGAAKLLIDFVKTFN